MMDVGRVCVKIAGRDAGKKCVIVEKLKGNLVMIDGQTRRRKCNTSHLEPLDQKLSISAKADHVAVKDAFKKLGVEVLETKKRAPKQRIKKAKVVHNTDKKKSVKKEETSAKPAKPAKEAKPKSDKKPSKE